MTRPKTILVAGMLSLIASGAALAHAHLKTSAPAANAVVQGPPASLTLNFSEGLELNLSGVKVSGPAGKAVTAGIPFLSPENDKVLILPLTGQLAPGLYTVDWHAVAKDTHATHGTYSFTIKP